PERGTPARSRYAFGSEIRERGSRCAPSPTCSEGLVPLIARAWVAASREVSLAPFGSAHPHHTHVPLDRIADVAGELPELETDGFAAAGGADPPSGGFELGDAIGDGDGEANADAVTGGAGAGED